MKLRLLVETLVYLKPIQMIYQVLNKVSRPKLKDAVAPRNSNNLGIAAPITKYSCYDGELFCFLNISDKFHSWNQSDHGMLWAYNLNYMDWLGQKGTRIEVINYWIDRFIDDLSDNKVGLDPYPIALRAINWIKVFIQYPECRNDKRNNSLYSQVLLLEKLLEYRLLGNHLLEDAYALFIASIYFGDYRLYKKASRLLMEQLDEQVLPDGAHFEQSPMYHCILLDRLLDCYNFSVNNDIFDGQGFVTDFLMKKAENMLGHLQMVMWQDGSIPLMNDAAYGIAPTSEMLFDYAKRLKLNWEAIPMNESGYRKMTNHSMEAIVDVGDVMAAYQPGHSHADTFNFELRIDGKPFVVDTGISTYNKTSRRQYERSTAAHNCVVVNGIDSSHVWGGFRVGRRAKVHIEEDAASEITASHDGYKKKYLRMFMMTDDSFIVEDQYDGNAVSFIHLAKDADLSRIKVEGANKIEIEDNQYSTEYNCFISSKVMKLYFKGIIKYTIR